MTKPSRTSAIVHRGWWPGWIWTVPLAALIAVGWLLIRHLSQGGTDIDIVFSNVHGLDPANGQIVYRGVKIGTVQDIAIAKDGKSVDVKASIDGRAAHFLRSGTIFWLRGANPSLSNLSSLGALLSGPSIVMKPGTGGRKTKFEGYAQKPIVLGPHGPAQKYVVTFDGAVGALKVGSVVKLRGFAVGRILKVGLRYDAKTDGLSTPVTFELYPAAFHIGNAGSADRRRLLRAAIARLVKQGLRAQLARDPPLIGGYSVTLARIKGAPKKTVATVDGLPEIPPAPSAGLGPIIRHINHIPVEKIAQNLLAFTRHANALVSSPKLADSIAQLDAALSQIRNTARNAGPKVTKLVATLHQAAIQLNRTARMTRKTLGAQNQNGLSELMRELTEAARSVRALADYLDRHPESLIQGRGGG